MDKMYIKNLNIFANHGVFQEEKNLGQLFILSLELSLNLKKAGRNNILQDTIHYGELCEKVQKEFLRESYDLIETAALKIAEFILIEYPIIKGVKVFLKKPWAPIHMHLDTVEIMVERKYHKAYIGLGSNIGNKKENLIQALDILKESGHTKINKCSTFIETKPWGYLQQDDFVNAVAEINTYLEPDELIDELLNIEAILLRKRDIKWGPRTVDLDIILYDNLIIYDENLIVPHPRMQEREFVLKPLCEIAPYLIHPVLNKSIFALLNELKELNESNEKSNN
ncbi:MAG: sulD: bifunctional folate synthesis protein [Bacillota bacterium]|nr:sulD: bifunctional folate synthesis protein [Bacillota bacterium]